MEKHLDAIVQDADPVIAIVECFNFAFERDDDLFGTADAEFHRTRLDGVILGGAVNFPLVW